MGCRVAGALIQFVEHRERNDVSVADGDHGGERLFTGDVVNAGEELGYLKESGAARGVVGGEGDPSLQNFDQAGLIDVETVNAFEHCEGF